MKKRLLPLLALIMLVGQTAIAQKWYQYGFRLGTSFSISRTYSIEHHELSGLFVGEFGAYFRAGKHVYGEIGLGYAFYKCNFSNRYQGYSDERVETRHLQIPIKAVGHVPIRKVSAFQPYLGIVYQPILKITENNIGFDKESLNTQQVFLTTGFDFKFGPITLGANYQCSFRNYFRNIAGKKPQFIGISAGLQF